MSEAFDGIFPQALQLLSPNQDDRPENTAIELLVIHNISLPPGEYGTSGVIDLFHNRLDPDAHPFYKEIRDLKVSAHFFIRRDGDLIQFVPTTRRAWHAGLSNWRGRTRCNDFSIGIELEGSDFEPFTARQYDALADLAAAIRSHHPIVDIAGHSDISPGRKTDPGPFFDWEGFLKRINFQRYHFD